MKAQILFSIFFAIHLNVYCQNFDSIPLPKTVKAIYSNTPLRAYPDSSTEIIYKVPKDSVLDVIGSFETYFKVRFDSLEGYVSYLLVKSYSMEYGDFRRRAEKIEQEKKQQGIKEKEEEKKLGEEKDRIIAKKNEEARLKEMINKYGQTNGEKIAKKMIWIGMTEEMLTESWGKPQDINSTVTRYGSRKQYVYGGGQYVYVVNGKVDAWQN